MVVSRVQLGANKNTIRLLLQFAPVTVFGSRYGDLKLVRYHQGSMSEVVSPEWQVSRK